MIHFGRPLYLLLLAVVPLLLMIVLWGSWRRRQAQARFAGSGIERLRSGRVSPVRRSVKSAMLLLVAALLALSIARPQRGQRHVILPREGTDVIIAMDVSRSMAVTDVNPSRFDQAKQAANALLNHLGGDRVGLVVFAGSSDLRFPLTTDFQAARQVIQELAIKENGVKAGTDIGSSLSAARDAFAGDKTQSKVIVLLSDGEDLTGADLAAAKAVSASGIILDTVGVGTAAGGPVFAINPRTNKSEAVIDPSTGKAGVSHRDDNHLRQLAATGHGTAYDGNTTDFAFDLSGVIDRLEKTRFESGTGTIPTERFQFPLAVALGLLLLESLIAESSARRRTANARQQPAASQPQAGARQSRSTT